ncbi:MAG TPA: hypothetical protein PK079_05905 [Leptospiraceae bacterium]|nr:hypothetical protein [Leptospiraceae bacterium]HMX34159.1 hypothetical protein [Leptospiraceae bacterium]HMY30256.1 hypothetical protein [Leptospiraceae bacterium]HMZ66139.1 hypothetical protein [Leptospiraceae bacterium]HNA07165.1 hypothetical protein [Leptospiraceae bacterium]
MIPEEIKSRLPLIQEENLPLLYKLKEHEHAPNWNYTCGDRLTKEDVIQINHFAERLRRERDKIQKDVPEEVLSWILDLKEFVLIFKENIKNLDIKKDFEKIRCMSREDIAKGLENIIPTNVSLDRLIVNSTSGTTGHPIITPNHPVAIGAYTPLLLYALEKHKVKPVFTKDNVGCMLVCAQKETAVYSTIVPMLNGTGFAKINLDESSWKTKESCQAYIEEFSPEILTGDPFSFAELINIQFNNYNPKAIVSTSMEMSPSLRKKLEDRFKVPVIDYYSLNETGPIAYSCPIHSEEFHILPTDIFIEITDLNGNRLSEDTSGDITITGGRNPYIPLLRYKTGDRAKIKWNQCECGESTPRLYDLETRKQVLFYNKDHVRINPIDITRILKRYPILQYEFKQLKDLKCNLKIRKLYDFTFDQEENLKKDLLMLFKSKIDINIDFDLSLDRKPIPYSSELDI